MTLSKKKNNNPILEIYTYFYLALCCFLSLLSFFIRLRCHFHLICCFFFHRRELLFIAKRIYWRYLNIVRIIFFNFRRHWKVLTSFWLPSVRLIFFSCWLTFPGWSIPFVSLIFILQSLTSWWQPSTFQCRLISASFINNQKLPFTMVINPSLGKRLWLHCYFALERDCYALCVKC